MAIDIQAKLAELRAKKAAEAAAITGVKSNEPIQPAKEIQTKDSKLAGSITVGTGSVSNSIPAVHITPVVSTTSSTSSGTFAPSILGTSKTTEIDHLEFLSKLNSLQDAMLKQHPTMPVLLMQIHKQLMADPELVTVLNEEAIGLIVRGLQVQTKTELTQISIKASTSVRAKKIPLSVDMF